jgi:hypothetical protein
VRPYFVYHASTVVHISCGKSQCSPTHFVSIQGASSVNPFGTDGEGACQPPVSLLYGSEGTLRTCQPHHVRTHAGVVGKLGARQPHARSEGKIGACQHLDPVLT